MSDVQQIISAPESEIAFDSVRKATGEDLEEIAGNINRTIEAKMLPNAIKLQWHMINVLVRTVVHLAKKSALMESDYRGRNK